MTTELRARQDGCIDHMDAMNLGTLAMQIGAGRRTKDDAIEPETGIVLRAKVGDCVKEGQVLAQVCHNVPLEQEWIHGFYDSISLSGSPGQRRPLIREILTSY